MEHNIFISYAGPDVDIVENLRDHLSKHGVTAWVYSVDRTLTDDIWEEIERKLRVSDAMIFAVSHDTEQSEGQKQELELVLSKMAPVAGIPRVLPIVLRDTPYSALPERLKHINGERLNAHNVKSVAWKIARRLFPEQLKEEAAREWRFPVPGEWLQVSRHDEMIEGYFDIGDKLYFRAISPIGLFECYAPKLNELFWIAPENVCASTDLEKDQALQHEIPFIQSISGMVQIYRMGWEEWYRQQNAKGDTSD